MRRSLLIALVIAALAVPAVAQESPLPQCDPRNARSTHQDFTPVPPELTRLSGIWVGTMDSVEGKGLYPKCAWDHSIRIEIAGDGTARVSFRDGATWRLFDAAAQVLQKESNAVIWATHAGEKANWVESWALVLTKKSADTLVGTWSRVVNNYGLALTDDQRAYAFAAAGELKLSSATVAEHVAEGR